ncbi:ornithine cyclodeaminase family protein [Gibbsiella dentisursi]|uniref:Alanine dehydrogenase n=1 Tax=Gibbsiella dentisursi TaxID=796890 RepID=A0ABP7KJX3_9GAMM
MTNNSGKVLILNEKQVKDELTPQLVLDLVEKSFAEYANGNAVNPVKLHLPLYPHHEGYINSMPSYLTKMEIAGAKVVSVFKHNMKEHCLPSTIGTIILHNTETGAPYAIMDGTYITAARTGAVIGVMAKYLAKQNSKVFTVVGAGATGLSAFIMINAALNESITEVRLVDISPDAQARFSSSAKEIFPAIRYVNYDSIQEACTGADIIVAAATASTPLYDDITFDKGSTLLMIEGDMDDKFANRFDSFIVDFKECFVERVNVTNTYHAEETGEPIQLLSEESVTAEIGDVITGKATGRKSDEDIIVVGSIGMGIQDIIVADYACKKAREKNKGTLVDFFNLP